MPMTSKVRVARSVRGSCVRPELEALEGRVVLSTAPSWVSIGPAPVTDPNSLNLNNSGNAYVNPPDVTGAIQAVATYRTPQGKVGAYVGSALGGVWQTQDLFAASPSWSTHTDSLPSLAISALGISPLDPTGATVFAGTGPTSNGGLYWSGYGNYPDLSTLDTGLYLTTDAGQTWTALNNASSPIYGTFISKVLPTSIGSSVSDETLLIGTQKGLFVSTDGGQSFAPQTFTNPVLDVIADPTNPQWFYLLAGPDGQNQGAGVYLSKNAGQSWTSINGGAIDGAVLGLMPTNGEDNGAGKLAATTQNGQTLLYMAFERNDTQNTYGIFSTPIGPDGSASWKLDYSFPNDVGGGDGNNFDLVVDPANPETVYITGYGGNSSYRVDDTTTASPVATMLTNEGDGSLYDTRAMAFATDPRSGDEVLVLTSDSGVYSLTDPATASKLPVWTPVMGNISVAELYSVSAAAGPLGQLYVGSGAQDTAAFQTSLSPAGQTSWVEANGGDGYGTAFDPASGMFYATSDNQLDLNVAQVGTDVIEPVKFTGWDPKDQGSGAFPSLVAVSNQSGGGPFTPRAVVFAAYGLYEAQPASLTSGTVHVTVINPADSSDTYSALSFGGNYQGAPDPYVLYAARGDGTLWYSDSLGAAVTQLEGWKYGTIVGLQQDPSNSHDVYALTKTALYFSQNAGQSWTPYATQPPSSTLGSFLSLGLVPTTVGGVATNLLLVGGVHGAEVLPDNPALASNGWQSVGSNLPNVMVTGFAYVPSLDELALSTFGRGDWLLPQASTQLLYPIAGQSSTTLTAPAESDWGGPVLLSAQVSAVAPGQPAPSGTVTFVIHDHGDRSVIGSASLDAAGRAQLFLPGGLPLGDLSLEADYSGDGNFAASQGDASTNVPAAATITELIAPPQASPTMPLTVAAHVNAADGRGLPGGTVTFLDGNRMLGSDRLTAGGVATLTVPPLAVGAHALTAVFTPPLGSPFLGGSTATASIVTVAPLATTVSLAAPTVALAQTPIVLTASIVPLAGPGTPGGTVLFTDGSTLLGASAVDPAGHASLTVPALAVGGHGLRVAFQPTAGSPFLMSASGTPWGLRVVPNFADPVATTTTLSARPSGPASLRPRSQVRFGIQVLARPAGPATGLVELIGGGQLLGLEPLSAGGEAGFTLPAARVLNRPVQALYLGGARGGSAASPSRSATFTPTLRWLRSQGQPATGFPHVLSRPVLAAAVRRKHGPH